MNRYHKILLVGLGVFFLAGCASQPTPTIQIETKPPEIVIEPTRDQKPISTNTKAPVATLEPTATKKQLGTSAQANSTIDLIAYAYNGGDNHLYQQIYVIDPDTGASTLISYADMFDANFPAWSPDGSRIALIGSMNPTRGSYSVWVMNADGSEIIEVFQSPRWAYSPAWTSDGRIVFGGVRCLTETCISDNAMIEVYLINSDGSNPVLLTNDDSWHRDMAVSPVDDQIAVQFNSVRLDPSDVYLLDLDGSSEGPVITGANSENDLAWSSDGRYLAYAYYTRGDYDVYWLDTQTNKIEQITTEDSNERYPTFSPDGKQMAFSSDRDGNYEIYLMNLESGELTRLTETEFDETELAWSP